MGPDLTDAVTGAIRTLFRLEGSRRIHQQLTSAMKVSISPQGLRLLGRVVEGGATTPSRLAADLDLDPAIVARQLRQLEDGGLVVRRRDVGDGRVTIVEATAGGEDTFARMREVITLHMRRAMSRWPAGDVAVLGELLGRLVADVQRLPYPALEERAESERPPDAET